MGLHIPTDVIVIVWSVIAATVLIMGVFTKLYRKAGPNEATAGSNSLFERTGKLYA